MPTNTPIPTATTGAVIPSATQNDMAVLNTCFAMLASIAPMSGTAPPVGAPNFQMQGGLEGLTLATSNASFPFPTAFPNGCLIVFAQPYNTSGNVDTVSISAATASTATLQYFRGGTTLSGAVTIAWFAIGF